jgi:hypothetical protein
MQNAHDREQELPLQEGVQIATASRNCIKQLIQKEFAAFERQEAEFRRKDRDQRAAELRLPPNDA